MCIFLSVKKDYVHFFISQKRLRTFSQKIIVFLTKSKTAVARLQDCKTVINHNAI
jgi:hypothetical protein